MLTVERLKQLLAYDENTGAFTWAVTRGTAKAGDAAGNTHYEGYICISIDYVTYLAHRLAWLYVYGRFPTHQIDHINRIRNDNRIVNLREATNKQNAMNRTASKNKGKRCGTYYRARTNKWEANIYPSGKTIYLGRSILNNKLLRNTKKQH